MGQRDVGELKLALVSGLFQADIKDIDGTAERSNTNSRAVLLPGNSSDRVVVFNCLAANFIPLRSLGIEVVDVESIEVSDHGSLTGGVESSTCEFFHFFVFRIVEPLEAITGWLVERNFAIITSSKDV